MTTKCKHETIRSLVLIVAVAIHSTGKVTVDDKGFFEVDGNANDLLEVPGFSIVGTTKTETAEPINDTTKPVEKTEETTNEEEKRAELVAEAKSLGLNFPANIKTETLAKKIEEAKGEGN